MEAPVDVHPYGLGGGARSVDTPVAEMLEVEHEALGQGVVKCERVGWAALFWSVPAGLLIEYLAVQKWLPSITEPGRAVIIANLISALAGILLFPILATIAELLPKTMLATPAEWSAAWDRKYHLMTLLGLIPLAALASTLIERAVMTKRFGPEPARRSSKILFLANLVSTSVAAFFAAAFL